ncbi:MAG: (2Fe-2S)-binding protein [Planctomycetes bacterium]|nr:(2Fe-2S)-binding protein [Planctomycetota bacterium]
MPNSPQAPIPPASGLSRRSFLKGSGAAAAGITGLSQVVSEGLAQEKAPETVAIGPGSVKIELTVNGMPYTASVEPRVTLLDALRNYMDVTGCKRVCDRGSCGACTVTLDGKVVYSCSMLALEARGKEIKTAEALYNNGKVDAVPTAFVKFDAQQCGFCTPGFVVAMRAALDKNPAATPAEVEDALSGNICRCGTYSQMRDTIASLCQAKKGDK